LGYNDLRMELEYVSITLTSMDINSIISMGYVINTTIYNIISGMYIYTYISMTYVAIYFTLLP